MKALRMVRYGDIESSLEFQFADVANPGAKEVVVRVRAASVNPVDNMVLRGDLKSVRKEVFPAGVGRDVSGEIVTVGGEVSDYCVGDQVFARVGEEHVGTIAEFITVDASHLAPKPVNLSHEEAAAIPLVALTSYQSLIEVARLKSGDRVLIHAGSGGIGSMAIQLAKSFGAYVVTTTSTANVRWVKELGADVVIDYKKEDYLKRTSDVDVVFDTLGGEYALDAFKVIKTGGRVVSISAALDPQSAEELGLGWFIRKILALKSRKLIKAAKAKSGLYRMVIMQANGKQLRELGNLYQDNIISPVIDKVYPFEQSKEAFSYLATGRAKGKVIISLGEPAIR
ncbi:NADP-dependent oxidoreductase [Microbulbifer sp. OS29]|uniref:NADP-dependent oxidoreductase n=1 Tax=Microbulbifer okhotskensis TaxID=2926617 RepID=A0A9X2ERY3_9GAMM|nr:NADP-dependent oxidoreductase [Microbulbifer okhotskensis]MCO1336685.1 NADP-dependent oxidoreductase [Microbulbifer okhotskensis]